jgi:hypothetical protein
MPCRDTGGEWLTEQELLDKGVSQKRVKAMIRRCMLEGHWKFDMYEARGYVVFVAGFILSLAISGCGARIMEFALILQFARVILSVNMLR